MAQSKTRASAKRSQGSKSQARSRGSTKSRNASSKAKSSASKSKAPASKSNGSGRVDSAREAVEHTAKDAGHAVGQAGQVVGRAASKAKVPLMAGGAALVGAAGGLALGTHQARRRHSKIGTAIRRRPHVKVRSRDVANAAKEVGTFGAQLGHLASELQTAREESNGGGKHRSPIEVVLEGLTARRTRA